MPFKDGLYKHADGFYVEVKNGLTLVSPGAPMSIRLSDLFDSTKWTEYKSQENGGE